MISRKVIFFLFLFLFCSLSNLIALEYNTLQYEAAVEAIGQKLPMNNIKYYSKDNKIRIDSSVGGKGIVLISNGKESFSYPSGEKYALLMPFGQLNQKIPIPDYKNDSDFVSIGEETISGRLCEVYSQSGDNPTIIWVDKELDFPLRVEVAKSWGKIVTDISNVKKNEPIDDSLFELPEDAKLIKIPFLDSLDSDMLTDKLQDFKLDSGGQFQGVEQILKSAIGMQAGKDEASKLGFDLKKLDLDKNLEDFKKIIEEYTR